MGGQPIISGKIISLAENVLVPIIKGTTVGVSILNDGVCGLSCPSCPVGNIGHGKYKEMDFGLFRSILDKLQSELKIKNVWLSNYNDAMLCGNVASYVRELADRNIVSVISTTLPDVDYTGVFDAGLSLLMISVSGFTNKYYGYYHGGDIEPVKARMKKLYGCPNVVIKYHQYVDNGAEIAAMRDYAGNLGFAFESINAFYRPAEKMIAYLQGISLPEMDRKLLERLYVYPHVAVQGKKGGLCKSHYKQLTILHDGGVAVCCHTLNRLPVNYLDKPIGGIRTIQRSSEICKACKELGLHEVYNA